MPFANPTTPNLADFTTFVYDQGVTTAELPTTSDYLTYSFNFGDYVALQPSDDLPAILYVMAVYNLGFHQLLKITPDQTGQTFFADQRSNYKLLSFIAGPVVASADNGTSQTLAKPEFLDDLTISALDLLKTPWGRAYLDYAQQYGPTIVDVS